MILRVTGEVNHKSQPSQNKNKVLHNYVVW